MTGGLTALGAGLYSLGIPKDSVLEYETAVKSGNYVLVAHGTPEEVAKAKSIVEETDATRTVAACLLTLHHLIRSLAA